VRFRLSQDALSAENAVGESTMDGPCPSATLYARPAHLYAKSTLTCRQAVIDIPSYSAPNGPGCQP
jgi:hypothetical protein